MTRIKRLSLLLALLPLACSDDGTSVSGSATDSASAGPTETGTATDSAGTDSDSAEAGTDSDSTDTDPATNTDTDMTDTDPTDTTDTDPTDTTDSGDGDGDTGDGDGDDPTTGDGDGDDPTTGDGDGDDPTTGDGDGDTGTGTDTEDTEMPCQEFGTILQPVRPNVMLVLDKSRSMFTNSWDHDNNNGTPQITRWNSLYQVTDNILTTFDQQINFGSILFPSVQAQNVYNFPACVTSDIPEVNTNPGNRAAILAAIPGPNVVNSYGGTPATLGVEAAVGHLQQQGPNNPRVMILITDGAANCDQNAQNLNELFEVYDDQLPVEVAAALANNDITTYVVGIDIANMVLNDGIGGDPNNINPSTTLNAVAQAGGTGTFYNSNDQQDLLDALTLVIEESLSCIIPLEDPPFFPDFTKVVIDGVEYELVDNCNGQDGFVYNNDFTEIELCGQACEDLKGFGEADVQYFCNPG